MRNVIKCREAGMVKNIAIISPSLNEENVGKMAGLLSKELSSIYNVYLFLLNIISYQ